MSARIPPANIILETVQERRSSTTGDWNPSTTKQFFSGANSVTIGRLPALFCSQNFLVASSSEGSGRAATGGKSDEDEVAGRITRSPDDRKYRRNAPSS